VARGLRGTGHGIVRIVTILIRTEEGRRTTEITEEVLARPAVDELHRGGDAVDYFRVWLGRFATSWLLPLFIGYSPKRFGYLSPSEL
jgi:hypothetical protein